MWQVIGQLDSAVCSPPALPWAPVSTSSIAWQHSPHIVLCRGVVGQLTILRTLCCHPSTSQVLDQDYDWVFGSDVTYNEEALLPLAKILRQMILTNEQAVVKLAHMHRSKELDKAMREIFHGEFLHQLLYARLMCILQQTLTSVSVAAAVAWMGLC